MRNTAYFLSLEDAELAENPLTEKGYNLGKKPQAETLYIRIENIKTSCYEIFDLHIRPEEGAISSKPSDASVCTEYVFPQLNGNQYYYTEPGGEGKAYKGEDVLTVPGEHTIYLLQVNSDEGCYEEISYKVNVTAPVIADVFEDVEIQCELYELQPLSEHNRYFTETNGEGMELLSEYGNTISPNYLCVCGIRRWVVYR